MHKTNIEILNVYVNHNFIDIEQNQYLTSYLCFCKGDDEDDEEEEEFIYLMAKTSSPLAIFKMSSLITLGM